MNWNTNLRYRALISSFFFLFPVLIYFLSGTFSLLSVSLFFRRISPRMLHKACQKWQLCTLISSDYYTRMSVAVRCISRPKHETWKLRLPIVSYHVYWCRIIFYHLDQCFPTWGTRTPSGTNHDIKGYAKKNWIMAEKGTYVNSVRHFFLYSWFRAS